MRILERENVFYIPHQVDGMPTDGKEVAEKLGADPYSVFKTLVTVGNDLNHYVFIVPVCATLDLKKAAKASDVKNVSMIKQKDLFPLTGYVHGGCSPIGMKKPFFTVLDETALLSDKIFFSAGKIGVQVEVDPNTILSAFGFSTADIALFE